jgi:hypothetical protein
MWWDWSQITVLDSILFSLVSVLILYIVGSGTIKLVVSLSKKADPFSSFDFFQKTAYRIVFGFVFVFLFALIFSFFNISFFISSLFTLVVSFVGFVLFCFDFDWRPKKEFQLRKYVFPVAIFALLFCVCVFLSFLISGYYGSTNDDAASHTLIVRIILDNANTLLSRSTRPYANFVIIYPSGAHVLCAFLLTVLSVPIQKIILMVSAILPVLIALSFYATVKSIFNSRTLSMLSLVIAGFFSAGLMWMPVSWGGLPLLMSLYLSVTSLGLVFVFLKRTKMTWVIAFFLGLIFFIAAETYPPALLIAVIWSLVLVSHRLFSSARNFGRNLLSSFRDFNKSSVATFVAFLVPLLFCVPYFYFLITHNFSDVSWTVPSSNMVSLVEFTKMRVSFNWLIDIPALSAFYSEFGRVLSLASLSLILLAILFLPRIKERIELFLPKDFRNNFFSVYVLSLVLLSYLTVAVFPPLDFLNIVLDPSRIWEHVFVPGIILAAIVVFSVALFFNSVFKKMLGKGKLKLGRASLSFFALLMLLIFTLIVMIPSVVVEQRQLIEGNFPDSVKAYQAIGADDLSLLQWMKQAPLLDGRILISQGDSGQYVTPITRRITSLNNPGDYTDLMSMLTSNPNNLTAIPLLIKYNITYFYVGSKPTTFANQYSYYRHFNATQFLSSSTFSVEKQFGDAWLFWFNATEAVSEYEGVYGSLVL